MNAVAFATRYNELVSTQTQSSAEPSGGSAVISALAKRRRTGAATRVAKSPVLGGAACAKWATLEWPVLHSPAAAQTLCGAVKFQSFFAPMWDRAQRLAANAAVADVHPVGLGEEAYVLALSTKTRFSCVGAHALVGDGGDVVVKNAATSLWTAQVALTPPCGTDAAIFAAGRHHVRGPCAMDPFTRPASTTDRVQPDVAIKTSVRYAQPQQGGAPVVIPDTIQPHEALVPRSDVFTGAATDGLCVEDAACPRDAMVYEAFALVNLHPGLNAERGHAVALCDEGAHATRYPFAVHGFGRVLTCLLPKSSLPSCATLLSSVCAMDYIAPYVCDGVEYNTMSDFAYVLGNRKLGRSARPSKDTRAAHYSQVSARLAAALDGRLIQSCACQMVLAMQNMFRVGLRHTDALPRNILLSNTGHGASGDLRVLVDSAPPVEARFPARDPLVRVIDYGLVQGEPFPFCLPNKSGSNLLNDIVLFGRVSAASWVDDVVLCLGWLVMDFLSYLCLKLRVLDMLDRACAEAPELCVVRDTMRVVVCCNRGPCASHRQDTTVPAQTAAPLTALHRALRRLADARHPACRFFVAPPAVHTGAEQRLVSFAGQIAHFKASHVQQVLSRDAFRDLFLTIHPERAFEIRTHLVEIAAYVLTTYGVQVRPREIEWARAGWVGEPFAAYTVPPPHSGNEEAMSLVRDSIAVLAGECAVAFARGGRGGALCYAREYVDVIREAQRCELESAISMCVWPESYANLSADPSVVQAWKKLALVKHLAHAEQDVRMQTTACSPRSARKAFLDVVGEMASVEGMYYSALTGSPSADTDDMWTSDKYRLQLLCCHGLRVYAHRYRVGMVWARSDAASLGVSRQVPSERACCSTLVTQSERPVDVWDHMHTILRGGREAGEEPWSVADIAAKVLECGFGLVACGEGDVTTRHAQAPSCVVSSSHLSEANVAHTVFDVPVFTELRDMFVLCAAHAPWSLTYFKDIAEPVARMQECVTFARTLRRGPRSEGLIRLELCTKASAKYAIQLVHHVDVPCVPQLDYLQCVHSTRQYLRAALHEPRELLSSPAATLTGKREALRVLAYTRHRYAMRAFVDGALVHEVVLVRKGDGDSRRIVANVSTGHVSHLTGLRKYALVKLKSEGDIFWPWQAVDFANAKNVIGNGADAYDFDASELELVIWDVDTGAAVCRKAAEFYDRDSPLLAQSIFGIIQHDSVAQSPAAHGKTPEQVYRACATYSTVLSAIAALIRCPSCSSTQDAKLVVNSLRPGGPGLLPSLLNAIGKHPQELCAQIVRRSDRPKAQSDNFERALCQVYTRLCSHEGQVRPRATRFLAVAVHPFLSADRSINVARLVLDALLAGDGSDAAADVRRVLVAKGCTPIVPECTAASAEVIIESLRVGRVVKLACSSVRPVWIAATLAAQTEALLRKARAAAECASDECKAAVKSAKCDITSSDMHKALARLRTMELGDIAVVRRVQDEIDTAATVRHR